MKQGLEGRLRRLEGYQAALDAPRAVSVRWITAAEVKQGRVPGLYRLPPEDQDSGPAPASVETEDVPNPGE
jgi:hypothetical protein